MNMITGTTIYSPPPKYPYLGAFNWLYKNGIYNWMVSLDVNSEYPSAIRTLNIGFENIITLSELPKDFKNYLYSIKEIFNVYYKKGRHIKNNEMNESNYEYKNGNYYKLALNRKTGKYSREKIKNGKKIPIKREDKFLLVEQDDVKSDDLLKFRYGSDYFNILFRRPEEPLYRDILSATIDLFVNRKIDFKNYLNKYNLSVAPNIVFFKKDKKSGLNRIMEFLYEDKRMVYKGIISDARKKIKDGDNSKNWEQTAYNARIFDLTFKILLNSGYGAFANRFFKYYNINIANAITSSSQFFIKSVSKQMDNKFNELFKTESTNYSGYIDTDSVIFSTEININSKSITVENFYNNSEFIEIEERGTNNYIKHLTKNKYFTKSVNKDFEIETKPISYIMKHKVKKEMFEITIGDKSVKITGDHSIMIKRNNKLISVKPKDILPDDKLLYVNNSGDLNV